MVNFIRCANARENELLQTRAKVKTGNMGLNLSSLAGTLPPERNHLAELGFALLANCGRALMHHNNVPTNIWYKVWKREAVKTATLLDDLTIIELNGVEATICCFIVVAKILNSPSIFVCGSNFQPISLILLQWNLPVNAAESANQANSHVSWPPWCWPCSLSGNRKDDDSSLFNRIGADH